MYIRIGIGKYSTNEMSVENKLQPMFLLTQERVDAGKSV
jgi:hypothetical protein